MANEERGVSALRHDSQFLDRVLQYIQTIGSDIKSNKDKRAQFSTILKILVAVISKGKSNDPSQDILKSPSLASSFINLIRQFVKID